MPYANNKGADEHLVVHCLISLVPIFAVSRLLM